MIIIFRCSPTQVYLPSFTCNIAFSQLQNRLSLHNTSPSILQHGKHSSFSLSHTLPFLISMHRTLTSAPLFWHSIINLTFCTRPWHCPLPTAGARPWPIGYCVWWWCDITTSLCPETCSHTSTESCTRGLSGRTRWEADVSSAKKNLVDSCCSQGLKV